MTELEISHVELRAILRLAGAEIRRLRRVAFGKRDEGDTALLEKMREVLRDARRVAKSQPVRVKVKIG